MWEQWKWRSVNLDFSEGRLDFLAFSLSNPLCSESVSQLFLSTSFVWYFQHSHSSIPFLPDRLRRRVWYLALSLSSTLFREHSLKSTSGLGLESLALAQPATLSSPPSLPPPLLPLLPLLLLPPLPSLLLLPPPLLPSQGGVPRLPGAQIWGWSTNYVYGTTKMLPSRLFVSRIEYALQYRWWCLLASFKDCKDLKAF